MLLFNDTTATEGPKTRSTAMRKSWYHFGVHTTRTLAAVVGNSTATDHTDVQSHPRAIATSAVMVLTPCYTNMCMQFYYAKERRSPSSVLRPFNGREKKAIRSTSQMRLVSSFDYIWRCRSRLRRACCCYIYRAKQPPIFFRVLQPALYFYFSVFVFRSFRFDVRRKKNE